MISADSDAQKLNGHESKPLESKAFDPFAFVEEMYKFIGSRQPNENGIGFDEWMNKRNKFVDHYMREVAPIDGPNYSEIYSLINAIGNADYVMKDVERLGKQIHRGVDLGEIVDKKSFIRIKAIQSQHTDRLNWAMKTGQVDRKWVATLASDALAIGSGIIALCARENMHLGRSFVDLGGRRNRWSSNGSAGLCSYTYRA